MDKTISEQKTLIINMHKLNININLTGIDFKVKLKGLGMNPICESNLTRSLSWYTLFKVERDPILQGYLYF